MAQLGDLNKEGREREGEKREGTWLCGTGRGEGGGKGRDRERGNDDKAPREAPKRDTSTRPGPTTTPPIHPNLRGRRHAAAGGARGSGWATPCPQAARLRHTRTCRHSAGRKRRPAQRHNCAPTATTIRGKISQPVGRQARSRSKEGAKAKHHAGTRTERHLQKGRGRTRRGKGGGGGRGRERDE